MILPHQPVTTCSRPACCCRRREDERMLAPLLPCTRPPLLPLQRDERMGSEGSGVPGGMWRRLRSARWRWIWRTEGWWWWREGWWYSTGPAQVEEDDLRGERSGRGRGKQGDTRNNRKAQPELRVLNGHCGRESNADARS